MRVAYIFNSTGHTVSYKLQQMILPQIEEDRHGADVAGMFFFDDNVYALQEGNTLGERLSRAAEEHNILLMVCDQCALERGMAEPVENGGGYAPKTHMPNRDTEDIELTTVNTVEGVEVGCFPDLYDALSEDPPDNIITL